MVTLIPVMDDSQGGARCARATVHDAKRKALAAVDVRIRDPYRSVYDCTAVSLFEIERHPRTPTRDVELQKRVMGQSAT